MDVSKAILAKSDQLNATDLMAGPQTVSIVSVSEGSAEQMVTIVTDVFGPSRPFKPSKTVLRVLANAWKSTDTQTWIGHKMTIYRDPSVRWAGEEIGGIRVSALSHIEKPIALNLPVSKGKHAKSTVTPIPAGAPTTPAPTIDPADIASWVELLTTTETLAALQGVWADAGRAGVAGHAAIVAAKDARKEVLS